MPKSNNIATALSSSSVEATTLVIVLLIQVAIMKRHMKMHLPWKLLTKARTMWTTELESPLPETFY